MKKIIILLNIFLFATACTKATKEETFDINNFKNIGQLSSANEIGFKDLAYSRLISLDKNFNFAILHNSDYLFAIYDDNLDLVEKLIKKEENYNFPQHYVFLSTILENDKILLSVNDFQMEAILDFSINLEQNTIEKIAETTYDIVGNIAEIHKTEKNELITTCSNIDSDMDYVRKYSSDFDLINKIPLDYTTDSEDLAFLWYNFNSTFTNSIRKINDDRYLITIPKIKELMLFNNNLDIVRKINTPFSDYEIEDIINNNPKRLYFSEPAVSDNYIIVPFMQYKNDNKENPTTSLLVFNHDLEPISKLKLNHGLRSISVSADESLLFVIDFKEEKAYIYEIENIFNSN